MMVESFRKSMWGSAAAAALTVVLVFAAGCKTHPAARTDQQISADVQAKISGESALASQNIQVSVANGVATLSGTVTDEASRALAGNDSGTVDGVKTVVNNLTSSRGSRRMRPRRSRRRRRPRPRRPRLPRSARGAGEGAGEASWTGAETEPSAAGGIDPAPAEQQVAQAAQQAVPDPAPQSPPAPPAPPKPVVKQVTLPAGTIIPMRITETLDSKTAQSNDVFHGSIAGDLGSQGVIAIPQGSPVMGRIVDAREAAHFKGASLLSIELTDVTARGKKVPLVTDAYNKEGAARGKNTAAKAGGGAVVGSIIGALAGGGKGAVIGGLAGGAAGTGVNAATRGEQAVIPTETLIQFRLQSPITMTVTVSPEGDADSDIKDPQLQHR